MEETAFKKSMGLSGPVWCALAGLGYGTSNVFLKLAFRRGATISRAVLIRHLFLTLGGYSIGKIIYKADFRIWKVFP